MLLLGELVNVFEELYVLLLHKIIIGFEVICY